MYMLALVASMAATSVERPQPAPAPVVRMTHAHHLRPHYPPHHGRYVNGREWVSRPLIGPDPAPPVFSCENPGPSYYGAPDGDTQRVWVRVGHTLITISPWERIPQRSLRYLENARIAWLNANGYTNSVRTFRNDAYHAPRPPSPHAEAEPVKTPAPDALTMDAGPAQPARVAPAGAILPRATIRLPDDAPRFRKRMQVFAPTPSRPELFAGQSCASDARVLTVRGEYSDGSVIRVLPMHQPEVASRQESAQQELRKPAPKAQERLASAGQ